MANKPISIYCPHCHRYTSLTTAPGNIYPTRYDGQTFLSMRKMNYA